jgi:hypothetical protein
VGNWNFAGSVPFLSIHFSFENDHARLEASGKLVMAAFIFNIGYIHLYFPPLDFL